MGKRALLIGVVGSGSCSAEEAGMAEEIGRRLARAGAVLGCGGLGGVMEAACRGAVEEGGLTVGILPGHDAGSANRYVVVPVATGLGEVRNVIIVRTVRAVIAVGGEYGTLSEIAFALKLGVPVVGLGTWRLYRVGLEGDPIVRAEGPADAVEKAISLARR
ncbi:MAG: TIGR00725 family protein [Dehalococcoidia bacterium]|nr:TIGR00725 family protein [Dehalococcoidia bacterium]